MTAQGDSGAALAAAFVEIDDCWEARRVFREHIDALRQRVQELEAALRFYADEKNHIGGIARHPDGGYVIQGALVREETGAIARAALAVKP
jgi:hypothetical protein